MSNGMTLDELKRQNEETDTVESETPQIEEETVEEEAAEVETEESEATAESANDETEETEVEAWMQSEDQDSQDAEAVPLSAHTKMRGKLKAKLGEKDDEIAQLRAEIESMKSGTVQTQTSQAPKRPTLEEHDYDEDRYNAALDAYYLEQMDNRIGSVSKQREQKAQQVAQTEKVNQAVDQHYMRASELVEKHGVSAEVYQAADQSFREVFASVLPQGADADVVADSVIAKLGSGSEKVVYAFGKQKALQAELQQSLVNDPSGIEAAILLGRKAAEYEAPSKRKTRAPDPAPQIQGDEIAGGTDAGKKLLKKYKEAHKSGNHQAAFNARREARKAGINTSSW